MYRNAFTLFVLIIVLLSFSQVTAQEATPEVDQRQFEPIFQLVQIEEHNVIGVSGYRLAQLFPDATGFRVQVSATNEDEPVDFVNATYTCITETTTASFTSSCNNIETFQTIVFTGRNYQIRLDVSYLGRSEAVLYTANYAESAFTVWGYQAIDTETRIILTYLLGDYAQPVFSGGFHFDEQYSLFIMEEGIIEIK